MTAMDKPTGMEKSSWGLNPRPRTMDNLEMLRAEKWSSLDKTLLSGPIQEVNPKLIYTYIT